MMNGHTEPSLSRLYDIGDALEIDIKTVLSDITDTIPYEILTGVSNRVKRVYFQD